MNQNSSIFCSTLMYFAPRCALLKHDIAQYFQVFPNKTPFSPGFSHLDFSDLMHDSHLMHLPQRQSGP